MARIIGRAGPYLHTTSTTLDDSRRSLVAACDYSKKYSLLQPQRGRFKSDFGRFFWDKETDWSDLGHRLQKMAEVRAGLLPTGEERLQLEVTRRPADWPGTQFDAFRRYRNELSDPTVAVREIPRPFGQQDDSVEMLSSVDVEEFSRQLQYTITAAEGFTMYLTRRNEV